MTGSADSSEYFLIKTWYVWKNLRFTERDRYFFFNLTFLKIAFSFLCLNVFFFNSLIIYVLPSSTD